jgi:pheromone alpha factor receptor
MASYIPVSNSSTDVFNPKTQVFAIIAQDGITQIPVSVQQVDWLYHLAITTEINYGSQIGASVMMLLVCLIMTPKSNFARIPNIVNMLALTINIIRCVLLAWFPTSMFYEFYVVMSTDTATVPHHEFITSVAATLFTIPTTILLELALAVQAWSMIQLWPKLFKVSAIAISTMVIVTAVGFKIADSIYQANWILYRDIPLLWVRKVDLACSTASICWFCFLFNVRLAMHMYVHRSVLPSIKGLSAMEVLVMTNGVLMIIPSKFSQITNPLPYLTQLTSMGSHLRHSRVRNLHQL